MRFTALLLAAVAVMSTNVEASSSFEETELHKMTKAQHAKMCKRMAARFAITWNKLDTNRDNQVTAREWRGYAIAHYKKHGKTISKKQLAHKMKHFRKWTNGGKTIKRSFVWSKIAKRSKC